MSTQELTPRQQQVLDAIRNLSKDGVPPTLRELGQALGITSSNGVSDALKVLERKGYLAREPRRPRCLKILVGTEPAMDFSRDVELQQAASTALRALRRGDAKAAEGLLSEVLGE